MRKALTLGTLVAALITGTATAGTGNGADVVKDAGCVTSVFATTCTVIKTITHTTVTPSGNVSYVTNGTVERRLTFVFGGSFTSSRTLHLHALAKQGETQTSSEHYEELTHYSSGTYQLSCASSYDIHYANGNVNSTVGPHLHDALTFGWSGKCTWASASRRPADHVQGFLHAGQRRDCWAQERVDLADDLTAVGVRAPPRGLSVPICCHIGAA